MRHIEAATQGESVRKQPELIRSDSLNVSDFFLLREFNSSRSDRLF
jgi:hypothetical protein